MNDRAVLHLVDIMEERGKTLRELVDILAAVGSDHVLIGGLAVGYHGRPRATAKLLGQPVNVIRRGALVALKFQAIISPDRKLADRYQDLADIGHVLAKRFDADDARLAGTVAATIDGSARARLEKLIDDLSHGRPVAL